MNTEEVLDAFRPAEDVEAAWPRDRRDALRDRILASSREEVIPAADRRGVPVRWVAGHRRFVVLGSLAACLALVGGLVAVMLPPRVPGAPDPAAAAVLERLAVVAGERGGVLGPGQYAYVAVSDRFRYGPDQGPEPMPWAERIDGYEVSSRQSWFAADGRSWSVRDGLPVRCLRAHTTVSAMAPTAAVEADALPRDPDRLAAYLDANPTGDQRGTRSRFTIVSDLMRSGSWVDPALRAAAIRMFAQTPGIEVTTGARDARGRDAIRVDFTTRERIKSWMGIRRYANVTESLFFDPATSLLLEERGGRAGSADSSSSVVERSTIVDRLPDLPACVPNAPEG